MCLVQYCLGQASFYALGGFWIVKCWRFAAKWSTKCHCFELRQYNNYSIIAPCNIVRTKLCTRVIKCRSLRGHGGPLPKSLDSDENFKPEHTLFCRELGFVAIYALFGDLWVKNSVSWARSALLHGTYHIFYCIFLQICDYAQKRRICRENCKYALDERFHGHFCPRRKPAKSCHPDCSAS